MDISVYGIGKHKPRNIVVTKSKVRKQSIGLNDNVLLAQPKLNPIMVCASTECHVTPFDIAQNMIEHLNGVGTLLEPSAGTGNLVFAALNQGFDISKITAVERNADLIQALNTRFKDDELTTHHQCFLDYSKNTERRFTNIVMNPPFKAVKLHVNAAKKLLEPNGVLVALVPITYTDDDFDWLEDLPNSTFSFAKVNTKLIRYRFVC